MLGSSGVSYTTTPQKLYQPQSLSRSTVFSSPQTTIYARGPPVSPQPMTIYSSHQQSSRIVDYSIQDSSRKKSATHAGPVLTHFGRGSPAAKVNESSSPNISADLSSSMISRRGVINPTGSYYTHNPNGRSDPRLILIPAELEKAANRADHSTIVQDIVNSFSKDLELTLEGTNDNMLKTLAANSANLLREVESDIQTELEYPDLISKYSHPATPALSNNPHPTTRQPPSPQPQPNPQPAAAAELRFAIQEVRRDTNGLLKILRSQQQAQLATSNSLFEVEQVLKDRLQLLQSENRQLVEELERLRVANNNEQYEAKIRLEENGRKLSEEFWRDIMLYLCLDDPRLPPNSNLAWWRDVRELAESLRMQYYQKKGILFLAKTRQAELKNHIDHIEKEYLTKLSSIPV